MQENETVSENLVMTTERVGILLGTTLNQSSDETVNISITTENISKYELPDLGVSDKL